jgi:hypothetical protein
MLSIRQTPLLKFLEVKYRESYQTLSPLISDAVGEEAREVHGLMSPLEPPVAVEGREKCMEAKLAS